MYSPQIKELLLEGIKTLKGVSTSPELDSEILLSHSLGVKYNELIFYESEITTKIKERYYLLIEQRKSLLPIAYILGEKEFYGLNFLVNNNVLIPRPETELIIDLVKKHFDPKARFKFLDIGTGSGCLGITISNLFPNSSGILSDFSQKALDIATQNAKEHQCNNIQLVHSNWFEQIVDTNFDLIVSNPPYISRDYTDISSIKFEPETALFAKDNGLGDYKNIAKDAANHLNKNGLIILEIGYDQAESVKDIFSGFKFLKLLKDYSDHDRVLIFQNL